MWRGGEGAALDKKCPKTLLLLLLLLLLLVYSIIAITRQNHRALYIPLYIYNFFDAEITINEWITRS